jgi:hypothetical protein
MIPSSYALFGQGKGLACPIALKAPSGRKRQFPELSNLPSAISVATTTTAKANPGEVSSRAGANKRYEHEDHDKYA